MSRFLQIQDTIFSILEKLPKTKGGKIYVSLPNRRKIFFSVFLKKYGLSGENQNYKVEDLFRRLVVFDLLEDIFMKFPYYEQKNKSGRNCLVFDTAFFRIVVLEIDKGFSKELYLLSIYPQIQKECP